MLETLLVNYEEAAAIILFGIGLTMLLFHRNLIKKLIGMNIMDTGTFLFLASMGYISDRKAPIITDGVTNVGACRSGSDRYRGIRLGYSCHAFPDDPLIQALSHPES